MSAKLEKNMKLEFEKVPNFYLDFSSLMLGFPYIPVIKEKLN